jgi:hypothetical protein
MVSKVAHNPCLEGIASGYAGSALRTNALLPHHIDAVPKKRGPKTDVLEALLKRVDGLEQKLKESKKSDDSPTADDPPLSATTEDGVSNAAPSETQEDAPTTGEPKAKRLALESARFNDVTEDTAVYSPTVNSEPSPGVQAEALLDTYFSRFHAKPYHILDESTVRQRLQLNQLPAYLVHAIYAVGARYAYNSKLIVDQFTYQVSDIRPILVAINQPFFSVRSMPHNQGRRLIQTSLPLMHFRPCFYSSLPSRRPAKARRPTCC